MCRNLSLEVNTCAATSRKRSLKPSTGGLTVLIFPQQRLMAFTPPGVSGRSAVIRVAMVFRYEAEAALLHHSVMVVWTTVSSDRQLKSSSAS